jgi:hypothetical protein
MVLPSFHATTASVPCITSKGSFEGFTTTITILCKTYRTRSFSSLTLVCFCFSVSGFT